MRIRQGRWERERGRVASTGATRNLGTEAALGPNRTAPVGQAATDSIELAQRIDSIGLPTTCLTTHDLF